MIESVCDFCGGIFYYVDEAPPLYGPAECASCLGCRIHGVIGPWPVYSVCEGDEALTPGSVDSRMGVSDTPFQE